MAYTVLQLITNAFYKSQIVSREFGTVSGPQSQVGLDCINKILSDKSYDSGTISYYQPYNFTGVVGQEEYFVPNLIDVDTLVFFINSVRYHVSEVSRRLYFGSPRAENINSLPYSYHLEKQLGGANIFLYFKPQQNYPFTLWGKFGLTSVTYNNDLTTVYDLFYIDFLEFQLSQRLCIEYAFDVPAGVQLKLDEMYQLLQKNIAPLDLSAQKISTLNHDQSGDQYLDANIAHGWRPY